MLDISPIYPNVAAWGVKPLFWKRRRGNILYKISLRSIAESQRHIDEFDALISLRNDSFTETNVELSSIGPRSIYFKYFECGANLVTEPTHRIGDLGFVTINN